MHRRPAAAAAAMVAAAMLFAPVASAAPSPRTWDLTHYTPPEKFIFQEAVDHAILSQTTPDGWCVINIYNGAAAAGDLEASFKSVWENVVLHAIEPVAAPPVTYAEVGGARAAVGGAASKSHGKAIFASLTLVDAGTKVVPILVMTPSAGEYKARTPAIQEFLRGVTVGRGAPAAAEPATQPAVNGEIPARPPGLSLADLGGEWKRDDGALARYAGGLSAALAGFAALKTKETWQIDAGKGTVAHAGGRAGAIALSADGELVVTPAKGGAGEASRYLVRSWEAGPAGAILLLNGPYHAEGIPERVRRDRNYGYRLNQVWLRGPTKAKPTKK